MTKLTSNYREGKDSTATSEGHEYQLDTLFKLTWDRKPTLKKVSDLDWILDHTEVDQERVKNADLSVPILVYWSHSLQAWIVIDGAHRLTKAKQEGKEMIGCRVVTDEMLDKARIDHHKKHVAVESMPLYAKW